MSLSAVQIYDFHIFLTELHVFFCHRYVNLDSQDKNALVSLSITDEPIAVDVIRQSNRNKVFVTTIQNTLPEINFS